MVVTDGLGRMQLWLGTIMSSCYSATGMPGGTE